MKYLALSSAFVVLVSIIFPSGAADQWAFYPANIISIVIIFGIGTLLWLYSIALFVFRFKEEKGNWWSLILSPSIVTVATAIDQAMRRG
jgi:hypothetical protein